MDDLDLLIHRWFEKSLTDEEEARLWQQIKQDDAAADRFVEMSEIESGLVEAGRAQEETPEETAAVAGRQPPAGGVRIHGQRRRARRGHPAVSPWLPILVAACALLGAIGFLALLGRPRPEPADPGFGRLPAPPSRSPTADEQARREARQELDRAERERTLAEERLAEIERERGRAEEARQHAEEEAARRKAEEDLARLETERQKAQKALEAAESDRRKAEEDLDRHTPTLAAIGTLERIEGDVRVLDGNKEAPAKTGQDLPAGRGLACVGPTSGAALAYPDGTRLELGPETTVREVGDRPKRLSLACGTLVARVAKQPSRQPMTIGTPHAEATVLGTSLRLVVDAASSRLEVTEGKVRLARNGRSVDVTAGHYAVAAAEAELAAHPFDPIVIELEDFGTARGVKPADGPVARIFLEPMDSASGGTCISVPGAGAEVTGTAALSRGPWYLWVRYRDEPGKEISFDVLLGDRFLGRVSTPGRGKKWLWKRLDFQSAGATRITLRSRYQGLKASASEPDYRRAPYSALNRWDQIVLTRDVNYVPEKE